MFPTGSDALQDLYRTADRVRAAGLTREAAEPLYRDFVEFVRMFAPGGRVLDVGCGAGWSTAQFADKRFDATGLDLNPAAFEPPPHDRLRFRVGSGTAIPFPDHTFDVAAANQVIEHVPDPAKMLDEMVRVVRPGGVVAIVGPNLLGLGGYVRAMTRFVWWNRPWWTILFRSKDMPRHPFGNTLPESAAGLVVGLARVTGKSLSRRAVFLMREPDLRPPFHSDNDAVYLCNPLDLARHLRDRGCTVLRDVAPGRGAWTRMLATGTWVAARTPG